MSANRWRIAKSVLGLFAAAALFGATPAFSAGPSYTISPVTDISGSCSSQNAEVEQAVDPKLGYVYEEWMGCRGIAFARSTDGGATFQTPVSVPGSIGSNLNTWDPAVTVAPDGTVYAAFMIAHSSQWYPVVAASFDHGLTFPQVTQVVPPDPKNWGDRAGRDALPDLRLRTGAHVGHVPVRHLR